MPSREAWAEGYLAQAADDLLAALAVGTAAPAVMAMLLQMTFEKAAKGILLLGKTIDVDKATNSHAAASILVAQLKREPELLKIIGHGDQYAYKHVLPLVVELERLHPQLVQGDPVREQQLEYPWVDSATNQVHWPARHLTIAQRLADRESTEGQRLTRFAAALLMHARMLTD